MSKELNTKYSILTDITHPSGALEFIPGFSGVHVTRSLVLCVCFVDRC